MVGDDGEVASIQVVVEMLDGEDNRQEFLLGGGVVGLGFVEAPAEVLDWVFDGLAGFLGP